MRNLIIAIAVMLASLAQAQVAPKTKECLVFKLELTMLKGVEAEDGKGSKYIHTDFVTRTRTEVFYYVPRTAGSKYWSCWQAKVNSNGKSLNGLGESRQDIMVMNPLEGGTDGFIAFVMHIPSLDPSTPSVNCYLAGEFSGAWDEKDRRYYLNEGSGTVVVHSYPCTWDARDFMSQAVPSTQSAIAPGWGRFTVTRALMTDAEIVDMLKNRK